MSFTTQVYMLLTAVIFGYSVEFMDFSSVDFSKLKCLQPLESYSRSPCPFINSLANCGLIKRDGKGILLSQIERAMREIGRVNKIFTRLAINGATSFLKKNEEGEYEFDLIELNLHNSKLHAAIEHDGSFTRQDHYTSDYPIIKPDVEMIEQVLSMSKNKETLTFDELVSARLAIINKSKEDFRSYISYKDYAAIHIQTIFTVTVLGRNDEISLDHARQFLIDEVFPKDWMIRETELSVFEMVRKLFKLFTTWK